MNSRIARREFLKAAPAAAGMLAAATRARAWTLTQPRAADYPIQPVPFSAVYVRDGFWKSKIDANARVTIPFEFQKSGEYGRLSPNVLQAAIYSLQTHPDPQLQAQVEGGVRDLV